MQEKSSPPLRDASTVILVRENRGQLETYLLRRSRKSGFMGGLYVFPGGVVDDQDRDPAFWKSRIDMALPEVANRFCNAGLNLENAVGFSVAAIRETLEEAGVLLASSKGKTRTDFQKMANLRLEKGLSDDRFKKSMAEQDWPLLSSSLGCWSHWITPERMKKRFDTRFFLVSMPGDQACVPDNLETTQGIWISPETALEKNLTSEVPLSPPTVVTLTDLSKFDTLEELKNITKDKNWGDTIAPVIYQTDQGPVILEPWDPQFGSRESVEFKGLEDKVLPPGGKFSRLWCDKGIWKPVDL